jgi:hypothetical protein
LLLVQERTNQAVVATDPQVTRWHVVCENLNIHQSEALVLLSSPIWKGLSRNNANLAIPQRAIELLGAIPLARIEHARPAQRLA